MYPISFNFFVLVIIILVELRVSFVHNINRYHAFSKLCAEEELKNSEENSGKSLKWTNPKYSVEDVDSWWNSIDKSLLTVGTKGVQSTHINSLKELLEQHERVMVKLASDKLDAMTMSKQFAESEELLGKPEVLQIRSRGLLFGSVTSTVS